MNHKHNNINSFTNNHVILLLSRLGRRTITITALPSANQRMKSQISITSIENHHSSTSAWKTIFYFTVWGRVSTTEERSQINQITFRPPADQQSVLNTYIPTLSTRSSSLIILRGHKTLKLNNCTRGNGSFHFRTIILILCPFAS